MKRHFKNIYGALIGIIYQIVYWALCYVPIFKLYQPVYGYSNDKNEKLTRECSDRWDIFSKHMPKEKGSVLDIGCNIGFFSFSSAALGHFATGIESDHFNITSCNAIKSATESKNCFFSKHLIDPDFVKTMPAYDTVINLSVFHHWVKAYGAEAAQNMMRDLSKKCSCLIFETGQPDEKGTKWADKMGFMGDNPKDWIETFLKDIGFKSVEMVGTFSTGLTQTQRYLFIAKK